MVNSPRCEVCCLTFLGNTFLISAYASMNSYVFLYRNTQAASQEHIKSGEFQDSPLSPPRLAKLKLQEDVSSSADCLLEHDGGGNPQAGLSTPVLAPKIPKCMHPCNMCLY